jgi:hypothetical protein
MQCRGTKKSERFVVISLRTLRVKVATAASGFYFPQDLTTHITPPTAMTILRLCSAALLVLGLAASTAHAQFAFGIEASCSPEDAFAKVTVPAATFAEIVRASAEGIPPADACLTGTPAGALHGFQADFDGNGSEEMFLLYAADGGCNVLAVLASQGGGSYVMLDMFPLPKGKALLRPMTILQTGVQMYVQSSYTLADGTPEVKGAVFALYKGSLALLTSWTQKNIVKDGVAHTVDVRTAFADLNFDGQREMIVRTSVHQGPTATEKNLVDRYVLTLDYMADHMRYNIYDSSGFDKMQKAEPMAKAGQRMLGRETTRTEGIIKMREALTVDPFLTESRVKLGEFFLMQGKYSDAEKTLLIAQQFEPDYAKTYKILGDTYLRLNDLQKSLDAYNTYLKLNPNAKDKAKVKYNIRQITVPRGRR